MVVVEENLQTIKTIERGCQGKKENARPVCDSLPRERRKEEKNRRGPRCRTDEQVGGAGVCRRRQKETEKERPAADDAR